jgi:hypothetical protein
MLIRSADHIHFMRLDLIPLPEMHDGWVSYRLLLGAVPPRLSRREVWLGEPGTSEEHFELRSTKGTELFLALEPENEVDALAELFTACADHSSLGSFTPLDERDFLLELHADQNECTLRVRASNYTGGWSGGCAVAREDLRTFARGLKLELAALGTPR